MTVDAIELYELPKVMPMTTLLGVSSPCSLTGGDTGVDAGADAFADAGVDLAILFVVCGVDLSGSD